MDNDELRLRVLEIAARRAGPDEFVEHVVANAEHLLRFVKGDNQTDGVTNQRFQEIMEGIFDSMKTAPNRDFEQLVECAEYAFGRKFSAHCAMRSVLRAEFIKELREQSSAEDDANSPKEHQE